MVYNTKSHYVFSLRKDQSGIASKMDSKLENLDVNSPADEIGENIDIFNFWINTRETSDDKVIKGTFLTVVGKEAFTLLKTLVYP